MNLHCDVGLSTVIFLHVIWQCQRIQLPTDPEEILFDVLSFGISLTCVKIKGSFLCQTSVKGWRFSWVQLFFSSYNRCLSFCLPFLPLPPGFIGYVIDAWDPQLLNFHIWLFDIRSFSETATEFLQIPEYLKLLQLHFTKEFGEIIFL